MSAAAAGETDRCLANLLRKGTIKELDEANALAKVECGDLTTDWLPWMTLRAGPDRTWHAPEVGEQVMVLSPSGDMAQGAILPAIYQDAHGAPANLKTTHRTEYQDGAFQQYDRAAHHFVLDVPAGGEIKLHIGAVTLTMDNGKALVDVGGSTTLLLEPGKATLTTPELEVDSPQSTFTGDVTVQGLLTYTAGLNGSGGGTTAVINGNMHVTGNITNGGNITSGGVITDSNGDGGA